MEMKHYDASRLEVTAEGPDDDAVFTLEGCTDTFDRVIFAQKQEDTTEDLADFRI